MSTCHLCSAHLDPGATACPACKQPVAAPAPLAEATPLAEVAAAAPIPPAAPTPPGPWTAPAAPTPPGPWTAPVAGATPDVQQTAPAGWGPPPPAPYSPAPGQPYWHPTYGWVPGQPQSTNALAIASLILSILWLAGIGSILGIIFGHVGRGQIRRRPEKGKGMALAGLIIGYFGVVATIALGVGAAIAWNDPGLRNSLLRTDIRNAAGDEQSYLVDHQTFTNDPSELSDKGFVAWPRENIEVAINGAKGFCIVGSRNNRDDWYLYDSDAGGLGSEKYPSALAAQSACTVPAPTSYVTIT